MLKDLDQSQPKRHADLTLKILNSEEQTDDDSRPWAVARLGDSIGTTPRAIQDLRILAWRLYLA
jgi:hypothetical protein